MRIFQNFDVEVEASVDGVTPEADGEVGGWVHWFCWLWRFTSMFDGMFLKLFALLVF